MFDASASESEDEVLFIEASTGRERLLRGIITGETADFVLLQRRDGDHEIARKTITKIVRRSGKKGFLARTVDLARQREEELRQKVFTAVFDAATALREAEYRNEDGMRIAELRKRLDEALRQRRNIR